jgi:hypothetical protein
MFINLPSFGFLYKPHPLEESSTFLPLPLEKGKGEVVLEGLRPSKTPYRHASPLLDSPYSVLKMRGV